MCKAKEVLKINTQILDGMKKLNYNIIGIIDIYDVKVIDTEGNILYDLVNENGEIKTQTNPQIDK